MSDLSELIARVKAAKGPDRKLDKAIHIIEHGVPDIAPIGSYGWKDAGTYWYEETGSDQRDPRATITPARYTSSLDAAIALCERVFGDKAIDIETGHRRVAGKLIGRAEICGPNVDSEMQKAATPALALCLAILTALESRK